MPAARAFSVRQVRRASSSSRPSSSRSAGARAPAARGRSGRVRDRVWGRLAGLGRRRGHGHALAHLGRVGAGAQRGGGGHDRVEVGGAFAAEIAGAVAAECGPAAHDLPLGAGDGDVEEPQLLGQGLAGAGVADRDQPLLHAGEVHDRPLEPLGRVEGRDLDGVAVAVGLVGPGGGVQPREEPRHRGGGLDGGVVAGQLHERVDVGPALLGSIAGADGLVHRGG